MVIFFQIINKECMNLFYKISFSCIVILTTNANAQDTRYYPLTDVQTSGPTYIEHYNKLKELYLKQLQSVSYKNKELLTRSFLKKMNFTGKYSELHKDVLAWIKRNIEKTNFETYEAAQKEWDFLLTIAQKEVTENNDFYEFKLKSSQCCGPDVFLQVDFDIRKEYPHFFMHE